MKYFSIFQKMVDDDNDGIAVSTTITNAGKNPQGGIIEFGVEPKFAQDAKVQLLGLRGEYMIISLFVKRDEFKKYKNAPQAIMDLPYDELVAKIKESTTNGAALILLDIYDAGVKKGEDRMREKAIERAEVTKGAMILDGYDLEDSCVKYMNELIDELKLLNE